MREEFTRHGSGDFSRRYQGTFGYFVSGDKKILVMVDQVGEHAVNFYDKNKNPYTANADQGNVFEFLPVERGIYDCGGDMIYLERRPARQWKRGICGENTMLYSFSVKDYMGVSFERLGAIFDPKPPKHTEKMYKLMMEGQRAGVALNHQFGLWNGEVYIYNRVIGKHTKDTVTVDEMFVQELKDVIRDLNLDLKVEAINAQAE